MHNNYGAWDLQDAISYYEKLRNKPEDIYESERAFFFPLVRAARSVLDIGCAAGGFYNIIRSVNPSLSYTGVDVSESMVKTAQKLFPGADFRVTDGSRLDFSNGAFDLVISLGVLNHVPDYKIAINEYYRVCNRFCLIDLPRLVAHSYKFSIDNSYMLLNERFHSNEDSGINKSKVPYVLADAAEVFNFLLNDLKPKAVRSKGYFGQPDQSVTIPYKSVCFTVASLEKGESFSNEIFADLPAEVVNRLLDCGLKVKECKYG